jgi:hypothetical protein
LARACSGCLVRTGGAGGVAGVAGADAWTGAAGGDVLTTCFLAQATLKIVNPASAM